MGDTSSNGYFSIVMLVFGGCNLSETDIGTLKVPVEVSTLGRSLVLGGGFTHFIFSFIWWKFVHSFWQLWWLPTTQRKKPDFVHLLGPLSHENLLKYLVYKPFPESPCRLWCSMSFPFLDHFINKFSDPSTNSNSFQQSAVGLVWFRVKRYHWCWLVSPYKI